MSKYSTPVILILAVLLLSLFILPDRQKTGDNYISGTYHHTEAGEHILQTTLDAGPVDIYMTDKSKEGELFADITPGDKIRIHFVLIEETGGIYTTNAFECEKVLPPWYIRPPFSKILEFISK